MNIFNKKNISLNLKFFKGATKGPSEFFQGIYYGMRSMGAYTIGGLAGATTR